jgi:hypothetical protein
MELKTLFKRESVADSLSIRSIQILPNQKKFNSGASSVPLQKSDTGGWRTGSKGIVGLKMAK